ncbi:FAD-linked oxidase [Intrasporangium oryzae NRRL B-24470]|uniref:FAD-linked oxidase n=1 Tax=Intrasporangium oryzae NRRL B-24470 TaxID=1386089 RepID=W9G8A2_9MICO|nr:FAD-binding oxidoreductase [Intrasporangium oryzae]EWT01023.1 FAD-linked oxidase [Intrasporangium oryzae NRRL B-24470]
MSTTTSTDPAGTGADGAGDRATVIAKASHPSRHVPSDRLPLDELATRVTGRLVRPEDAAYDDLTLPFNLAIPVRPLAVVEVATPEDVVEAVRFAGRHGVEIGVQATGHGARTVDGAILVHTSRLDELTIHPEGWARVGAGVRWQRVLDEAALHGLAALAGSAPGVGVVGYTTGGGFGPVARTHGLASDHVRAFEVVTGDGVLRRATADEHPDLFWALRGGKGALGIVTAVEFDLLPISTIYGGAIWFDAADTADVLEAWRTWSEGLPSSATTSVAIKQLPDVPELPAPIAGRMTISVRFAWTGDVEAGREVFAPMRSVATALIDGVDVMPYAALGAIHMDPPQGMPATEAHVLLDSLPREAVDALVALVGPGSGSPQVVVEVRQLGGAVAAGAALASAVSHRTAPYSLFAVGVGLPGVVEQTREHAAWMLEGMAPWSSGRRLVNFTQTETLEEVNAVYDPQTRTRLAQLAAYYDPHGIISAAWHLRASRRG